MARQYTVEELLHLRESPLCIKPNTLPPAEEWMGPPPENFRTQGNKPGVADRNRNNDSNLLENRRPAADRRMSRNSANPDDIILGPPRMTFSSATSTRGSKPFDSDKNPKDNDSRDRFAFRPRNGDGDNGDRLRDNRNNFRRRGDGEDSDGWSTVKPRKSFGHEGAERFHGRMGDRPDRLGGERRTRDPEDRETTDRPRRNFGEFAKEGEDEEKPRRNGMNRNRSDQPWTRDNNEAVPSRERFDRAKSWRDRAADQQGDTNHEKPRERTYGNRWDRDRDHRQEREPEWLDQPLEEQAQTHTQEDFKKFMENMKGKHSAKAEPSPTSAVEAPPPQEKPGFEKTKVKSAPSIELGHDKFFAAFAQGMDTPGSAGEDVKESAVPTPAPKPKSGSRFQTFFEESRRQTEPPIPVAAQPPPQPPPASEINPLLAMAGAQPQSDTSEKVAFQALLQKLQKQTLQTSTPPSTGFSEPPPRHEYGPASAMASPSPFQQYGHERREELPSRGPLPQNQEIHAPRPHQNPQFAAMRPEQQMLHDLIGQRHPSHSSGPGRAEQPPSRNNSNAEFLMTLMQSARAAPEPQRNEQPIMRMPQPSRPAQIPPTPDREPDYQRERGTPQHHGGRPVGLPTFFDEPPMHHREQESRPQQPTQILQRQGPPGLDQMHPPSWMQTVGQQQLPPQGRGPMIPPPGLAGNPRNGPMPNVFPPNFAMGGFPPDAMAGPPRNLPQAPPPGFPFPGPPPPPPGFMQHPGMGGFQGPEALAFGFDGRGMPPPGAGGPFRRN